LFFFFVGGYEDLEAAVRRLKYLPLHRILRLFKPAPHPNILRVSSFIITPSYALMTMAFHPAILSVRLGERSARARRYIRGLLQGTDFLHQSGVSHNDIKPANVVLSVEDEPVLIDFG
jgi:serine/threonine protein kinase